MDCNHFRSTVDVSVVITSFNEYHYLDSLLDEIQNQKLGGLIIEILLVEAGDYPENRARFHLKEMSALLKFYSFPGISRTSALNYLFENSKGGLIVRLDARSSIEKCYINRLFHLSNSINADNVGGAMIPAGSTTDQNMIAKLMTHRLSFGGGKSRSSKFIGYVDSVYLGAYNRLKLSKIQDIFFDVKYPQISEDSDLNYRIRKCGGKIFLDSSIKVKYHARETLLSFFKLCYNYGVARGLFILKHKRTSAFRQLVPIFFTSLAVVLYFLGLFFKPFQLILLIFIFLYFVIILLASILFKPISLTELLKVFIAFLGCHFFWTFGLLMSISMFYSSRYKRPIKFK